MLSGKACQFGKNENVLSFIKLLNHVMDKNVTTSNISDNFLIVSPLICFESTILHNKNSEFSRWIKQIDYSMLNTKIKYLICDVKFNGNNKPFIKYNNKSYFTSSVPYKEENQYPIYFHFKNKHEVNTFERVYSFFVSEYDKSFSMFNDFELKQYSNKDKYEYLKFIVSQKNINQDLNIKHER